MQAVVLFLLALPLAALKTSSEDSLGLGLDAEAEAQDRPVMKVVRLLQDMKEQLETEKEDDQDVHEKMICFCDENEKEKTQAIEDGGNSIQQLTAALGETAGKLSEDDVKLKDTKDELKSNREALSAAKALRAKENKAFAQDEKDTVVAIKATTDAITVLSKHNTGLVEVRAVAKQLTNARVLQMGILDNLKQAALKDFLQDAQGASSFLSIPGFQSHGSQSGAIFGILNQMKDDFEDHLSEIQDAEKKALSDFGELEKAKKDQISDGKKEKIVLETRIGESKEKQAKDTKSLGDAKDTKVADEKFLSNLQKDCTEHNTEYDTRTKDRLAEITAVESAMRTLNSEESFKLFDKSVGFLQISSAATEGEHMKRQSAASVLERAAAQADSPILALLAGRVRNDAFTEVNKAIANMVKELKDQQKDEVDHNDWCKTSFQDNDQDTQAASDNKGKLEAKERKTVAGVKTLDQTIASLKSQIAESQKQMKRSSETREAANAAYQETIADQRTTQIVLNKALTTLKQVYALLENGHRAHHNHKKAAQAPKFKKDYAQNTNGGAVLAMLEKVLADSKTAEADAMKAETNAQTTYETFMTDSNDSIKLNTKKIMTSSGDRATAQEELLGTKKDIEATKKKLTDLASENGDLHGSCDFIQKNFDVRQAARGAEIDALNEAVQILSGSMR